MGMKQPLYLDVPIPAQTALREVGQAEAGDIVLELCDRCWGVFLKGKREAHLAAVSHRQPPMGAQSPEG